MVHICIYMHLTMHLPSLTRNWPDISHHLPGFALLFSAHFSRKIAGTAPGISWTLGRRPQGWRRWKKHAMILAKTWKGLGELDFTGNIFSPHLSWYEWILFYPFLVFHSDSLMISEVIRNGNPDEHPESDRRSIPWLVYHRLPMQAKMPGERTPAGITAFLVV